MLAGRHGLRSQEIFVWELYRTLQLYTGKSNLEQCFISYLTRS